MSRRRNGFYQRGTRYYFKLKTEDGWKEVATRTSNYAAAQRIKTAAQREVEEGRLPNDRSQWTLETAVREWLPDRKLRVAPGSFNSNVTHTRQLLRLLGKGSKLIKLADPVIITRYQSDRLREGRGPKSVNNELLTLASILQTANLWHRVAARYKPLKVTKSDVGQALSRQAEQRLLRLAMAADADSVAPYSAVLAMRTFLRHKEIRNIRLKAIHLDGSSPYLQVLRESTKSDYGARRVPLDRLACWALNKLLARAHTLGSSLPDHFLLPTNLDRHTRTSDPLHGGGGHDPTHAQTSWDGEWIRLKAAAKISDARFHDLRHTGITRAAEAGVPLAIVQEMAGHFSPSMTRYYLHICDGALQSAMIRMESNSGYLLDLLRTPTRKDRVLTTALSTEGSGRVQ